jgi:hypothetical protein
LKLAGCLGANNELIIESYREALEKNLIDIDLLRMALGEEQLDEKFMKMAFV